VDLDKIRSDFPALSDLDKEKPLVYFDNASESLRPKQVTNALVDYYSIPRNNWSGHRYAMETMLGVKRAREKVQKLLNAKSANEIIWTRNATEAINLISRSIKFEPGDIVLTTDKEHNSNMVPWHNQAERGVKHHIIKSNEDLTFDMDAFDRALNDNVKLVSMAMTSIVDGYTIPAAEIIKTAHEHGALVLLDAVLAIPHGKVDVQALDVDFLAFSFANMLGPNGVGVLYGKEDNLKELDPFLGGGGSVEIATYEGSEYQNPPAKFEAGNLNYPGMLGAGEAIDYLTNIGMDKIRNHVIDLNSKLTDELLKLDGFKILGPQEPEQRGSLVNFNLTGFNPHDLAIHLEEEGNVLVRSGAQCAHAWFIDRKSSGVVSVSFQVYNTTEEVERLAVILKNLLNEMEQ
jgi:cysteine desulfurase/selenocysteine lyase